LQQTGGQNAFNYVSFVVAILTLVVNVNNNINNNNNNLNQAKLPDNVSKYFGGDPSL
jgi:hypothetical protein